MKPSKAISGGISATLLAGCAQYGAGAEATAAPEQTECAIELIVLGAGQDAGAPQIGNPHDPAWADPALRLTPTSIALVDHAVGRRYLFDATPQITQQMNLLDTLAPGSGDKLSLSGVFLTHAHIGHYAGLMYLGREAAGASSVPVYAMPRMADYLQSNGPWGQLVDLENIELKPLEDRVPSVLSEAIQVTPYRVPHRDEYSETVGFLIETHGKNALYLPDIDSWDEWDTDFGLRLEDMLGLVDFAFVDATFYDNHELPGRDMTLIPHPRVTETMERLDGQRAEVRSRVQFIHYNHTNPIRFLDAEETADVYARGFNIARAGDRHCLVTRVE
ncbi:MAG: MBL fold metallo-hydrolase [Henriciella sp.]